MTDRPLLTRSARLACEHPQTVAVRSDLPNSYGGRQWCRECGVFFGPPANYLCNCIDEQDQPALACEMCNGTGLVDTTLDEMIDWPATDAADREQMEREGQMRLPEE